MSDTQQPQPTESGVTGEQAAAALADIERRHGQVIKAVLVPGWYWWAMAAGMVAIGATRDSGRPVVQAIVIPVAALGMAALTGAMIPAVRRRVQLHRATKPGARGTAAIVGLIVLVDGVIVGTAAGLAAAHAAHPGTIATAAGAIAIVIAGPLVNRYLSRLMLDGPHLGDVPEVENRAA
ncbi:MAG: hypothetical protein ABI775_12800 [Pseudonocardiales bacterium]